VGLTEEVKRGTAKVPRAPRGEDGRIRGRVDFC